MPDSRYPKACYNMLCSLDQHGRKTWAGSMRQLLCKYGHQDVWEAQRVENVQVFLRDFTNSVKQDYDIEWENSIAQSSKLSLYRLLKPTGIARENYLRNVTLKSYRSSMAKLRCSSHQLRIEKGRHSNELMADRVCKMCLHSKNHYVLEDEYHFVSHCPVYSELRDTYLPQLTVENQTYEYFVSLMYEDDDNTQRNLAAYIFHACKLRYDVVKEL